MTVILGVVLMGSSSIFGQTSAFTFQGKLTDGSLNANGPYDLTFRLFDSIEAGTQIGADIVIDDVNVSGGLFTVSLDFGQAAFSIGDPRFVQISIRQGAGTGAFTELTPRQQITSAPYAVKSAEAYFSETANLAIVSENSAQLGGISFSQYVLTNDPRMTDARPPTAGSENYIQNTTSQTNASFNINGSGRAANGFDSASGGYRIQGNTILNGNGGNLFVGVGASTDFGVGPVGLSLLGAQTKGTGIPGVVYENATAIGFQAAVSGDNAIVLGRINGVNGATSSTNVGIGTSAPTQRLHVVGNSLLNGNATVSGSMTLSGSAFVSGNATVSSNVGIGTGTPASPLHVNGAILVTGPRTSTPSGNAMTISSDAAADTIQSFGNRPLSFNPAGNNVGVGTTAPETRFHIESASNTQLMLEVTGGRKWVLGNMSGNNGNFEIRDQTNTQFSRFTINSDGNIGAGTQAPTDRLDVNGTLRVRALGSAGSESLCRNASGQISTCSSSLRYKDNVVPFGRGMEIVRELNPITFSWKGNGALDLGLGAEEVAAVDPLLVNYNEKGEVEGVKYDRVGVVLVNAVKEQQAQIVDQSREVAALKEQVIKQQSEIEDLKRMVCSLLAASSVCSLQKDQ